MSLNINLDGLMTTASSIFNAVWPAMAIVAGLTLGIGIARFVSAAIRQVF